jgi:hypothetical protein
MSFSLKEILEKRAEILNESDTQETVLIDSEKVLNPIDVPPKAPIRNSSLRERIFSRQNSEYLEIGGANHEEIVHVETEMNNILLTKIEDIRLTILTKKKYYFLSVIILGGLFVLNDYILIKHYH